MIDVIYSLCFKRDFNTGDNGVRERVFLSVLYVTGWDYFPSAIFILIPFSILHRGTLASVSLSGADVSVLGLTSSPLTRTLTEHLR